MHYPPNLLWEVNYYDGGQPCGIWKQWEISNDILTGNSNTTEYDDCSYDTSQRGVIIGTNVILRQNHESSSKILGSFKKAGEKVSILDEFTDYNSTKASMLKDYSTLIDGDNQKIILKKGETIEITGKFGNNYLVRFKDTDGYHLREIHLNMKYLDFSMNKWYKIKRDSGEEGWVFGEFINF